MIGLTFCTFLPSPFPIRSPDWSFCVAQTINFRFSDALVTCSRCHWLHRKRENNFANPDAILQTAFGLWNSKVLLTAVTFELFTALGQRRFTGTEIGKGLELHSRGVADFLDALVAMKFLEREGDGADANILIRPPPLCISTAAARATSAESRKCTMRGCSRTGMICRKRCAPGNRKTKPSTAAKTYSMNCMPTLKSSSAFSTE